MGKLTALTVYCNGRGKLTALTVYCNGRKIQMFVKGTQVAKDGKTVVSQSDMDRALRAVGANVRGQTYSVG